MERTSKENFRLIRSKTQAIQFSSSGNETDSERSIPKNIANPVDRVKSSHFKEFKFFRSNSISKITRGLGHRRTKSRMNHTIEVKIRSPSSERPKEFDMEPPSPFEIKLKTVDLMMTQNEPPVPKKREKRRRSIEVTMRANQVFMRNTMLSVDEPETFLFVANEERVEEDEFISEVLKNHFIFFFFKKQRGNQPINYIDLTEVKQRPKYAQFSFFSL